MTHWGVPWLQMYSIDWDDYTDLLSWEQRGPRFEEAALANRSYLVVLDQDSVLPTPAVGQNGDEPIVATGTYCVPMLWLALFRPGDFREQVENGSVRVVEPLASMERALKQLSDAVPVLDEMFADRISLSSHAQLLQRALQSCSKPYVGISWAEIAEMGEPKSFLAHARYACGTLAGEVPIPIGRKSLLHVSEHNPKTLFAEAKCLLSMKPTTKEEIDSMGCILGFSYTRPVPWETPEAE